MEKLDPQGDLWRLITITEPSEDRIKFLGDAMFGPARPETEILPIVKALLKVGFNTAATNKKRETALHLAVKNGGGFPPGV